MTYITEEEFRDRVADELGWMLDLEDGAWKPWAVTGPGRSGAIASVYVSYFLHVPFIQYGATLPADKRGLMIVDTALNTGATMRRALRRYKQHLPILQWFYNEPPRVHFWYERWNDR